MSTHYRRIRSWKFLARCFADKDFHWQNRVVFCHQAKAEKTVPNNRQ